MEADHGKRSKASTSCLPFRPFGPAGNSEQEAILRRATDVSLKSLTEFILDSIVMKKKEIVDIIRSSKPEIESRFGVRRLGLFGSYARGQERKRSDIDILVSFNRDIDLFEFIDLREFLEARLYGKVDLVMESALKPAIGKRILAEVEYV